MRLEFGSRPEDLEAAVGPAIGGCCYAVGEEVRSEFESQFSYAGAVFRGIRFGPGEGEVSAAVHDGAGAGPQQHWTEPASGLAEANRRQLQDAGLSPKAIHMAHICTACNPTQFFSYRAERGFCGRMMAVIGRRD